MPHSLLTEDFLAICLVLADGDAQCSVGEVLRKADQWQKENQRVFGIKFNDLKNAFYLLENQVQRFHREMLDLDAMEKRIQESSLGTWIEAMLSFREVNFRHRGSPWQRTAIPISRTKLHMQALFSKYERPSPQKVMEVFSSLELDKSILNKWSTPKRSF